MRRLAVGLLLLLILIESCAEAMRCKKTCVCKQNGGKCQLRTKKCNGKMLQNMCCNKAKCACCVVLDYNQDIENNLSHFIYDNHTVEGSLLYHCPINVTVQDALVDFLDIQIQYLVPNLRPTVIQFLTELKTYIQGKTTTITISEMRQEIENINKPTRLLPRPSHYGTGCQGSNWTYPCGIWITLHTISVNLPTNLSPQEARRVLPAIRDFIDYLFWCHTCQHDFLEMYKNYGGNSTQSADDVVFWLWGAHNRVNLITANETDQRPKHLVPTLHQCPECSMIDPHNFTMTLTQNDHVLSFLRTEYGTGN